MDSGNEYWKKKAKHCWSKNFGYHAGQFIAGHYLDMPLPMADNIVTNTLLTSDLRGIVYKPYYYFYNTSDSVGLHLDLVMLTKGGAATIGIRFLILI